MNNLNIAIIGAGGVTSYMLGPLLRTFKPASITIFDRDTLEKRNLDRQLFNPRHVDLNKAEALKRFHQDTAPEVRFDVVQDWFIGSPEQCEGFDANTILISCADNHVARVAILNAADRLGCPAIIGGNEYFDSEAYLYLPEFKGSDKLDPRVRYPSILTDTRGSPLHCQEEQEIHPQLAVANMSCAAKILQLIWGYQAHLSAKVKYNEEQILVTKLFTSIYENTHERTKR